ncbi:endolytic transglycosylase MltG [Candidatus Parcubacteria bacterium]|nr:endolytic transglycosylase MltG [Candidatus Parcubacteria bacterium]
MRKRARSLIILTLGFLLILTLGIAGYRTAVNRRNYVAPELVEFVVSSGEGAIDIARRLRQAGLIRSPILFAAYIRLSGAAAGLQAGRYYIGRDQNIREIAALLQHGTFDIRLTIPEGWRREEIAVMLAQGSRLKVRGLADSFLEESEGLEGYLFPDTYLVEENVTAAELVAMMRGNFDEKVDEDLRAHFGRQGLSLHQAVILASIVEREVKFEEDRAKVAGILLKRFENGWPLEADATVQFAVASANRKQLTVNSQQLTVNWWPQELTWADLETDSPYNTRLYPGLPPAPICNPGLAPLSGVAEPEDSPFWFYISDESGKMHYAVTLEEHNQNVSEYLLRD